MKEITTQVGMKATIDPLKAHEGIKDDKLLAAIGLLPYFAAEVYLTQPESVTEAWELLQECYGYGYGQDGTYGDTEVTPEGVWKSPEDPDLSPLVAFQLTDEIQFLVYQYALVAVTDGEETLCGRMD